MFILVIAVMAVLCVVRFRFTDYYDMTQLGLPKIPIFIVGCYFGYLSKEDKSIGVVHYSLMMLFVMVLAYCGKKTDPMLFTCTYEAAIRLITIPSMCMLLSYFSIYQCVTRFNAIFKWLGKYSLELYILHMFLYGWVFKMSSTLSPIVCGFLLFSLTLLICQPVHYAVGMVVKRIKSIES